jgi:hypothetical protein
MTNNGMDGSLYSFKFKKRREGGNEEEKLQGDIAGTNLVV